MDSDDFAFPILDDPCNMDINRNVKDISWMISPEPFSNPSNPLILEIRFHLSNPVLPTMA
jgi:hypothetical protein